jgi:hypothetical protein
VSFLRPFAFAWSPWLLKLAVPVFGATLDALSLRASDYANQPSNTGSASVAIEAIRAELIPKIKAALSLICTKTQDAASPAPRGTGASRFQPPESAGFDAGVAAELL